MHRPARRAIAAALGLGLALGGTAIQALPAQAAITPSSTDSDGDGLPDTWETNGVDTNGDGVIDLDLPAMGANPQRADIFVELDWMPGLLPSADELGMIRSSFASLPNVNPDGSTGISIHLDAGSARGAEYNLGGGNEIAYKPVLSGVSEVATLRKTQSNPARNNVFHYAVFGDAYGTGSSSGQANINGLNLLVTVGPKYWSNATSITRVGTFIHELGHNLGLRHGGNDDVNYKPNYLSIMNYSYQLSGVLRTNADPVLRYSTLATPTLDENGLNVLKGLGPDTNGYDIVWWTDGTKHRAPANGPHDFVGDFNFGKAPRKADINRDSAFAKLNGPNDMQLMRLDVGTLGDAYTSRAQRSLPVEPEVTTDEMTAETAERINPEVFGR